MQSGLRIIQSTTMITVEYSQTHTLPYSMKFSSMRVYQILDCTQIFMQKTSDLVVRCLEAQQCEYVFWVPWEENLDLLESLRKSSIKLIVTRNEQSAVFMAATYGRLTWKAGVALATLWPWATNMMTWVAYAQLWGMPVVVITWQKPIKQSKQWKFQIIDVVDMMQPVTKFSSTIVDGSRVPALISHAFVSAESEKPWAVHLELPEDIAWEMVVMRYSPIIYKKIRRPIPDPKAIDSLVDALNTARTPMILVWAGANRKRIRTYLTKLIQDYNIPFFTSQMWKWVVDERLPQYIWTAALTSHDYIHDIIRQSDLIIAVWHDTIEKPTHIIQKNNSSNTTDVVHVNFTPAQYDELYKPSLQIIGDIWNTLRQLTQSPLGTTWRVFEQVYALSSKTKNQEHTSTKPVSHHDAITPPVLIKAIRDVINEEDIIALDNGLYKVRFARNYPCYYPNTLLLDNALATMWAGYSSAFVAKMLNPDKNVLAVVWDGWLMMNPWDLLTCVHSWLDLIIIVLNDNAYGMIKRKQQHLHFKENWLDLSNPNFVTFAESLWATWYLVKCSDQFTKTIKTALQQPWVKLIEVLFEYPQEIQ